MADYPCDLHLARYRGPSHRIYLNVYREEEEIRMKASVCGDCLAELMTCWLERALHMNGNGVWDPGDNDLALESIWRPAAGRSDALRGRR